MQVKIDRIHLIGSRTARAVPGFELRHTRKNKMEIYVGNLAYATKDEGLKAAFEQFGEVTACRVVTDRMTGRSKGFGFVTMPDPTQAQAAIDALNGRELDGRTVRVNESQPKPREDRRPSGRGFRGGDRPPRRETRW